VSALLTCLLAGSLNTNLFAAAWWDAWESLPTVEEMEAVWDFDPEDMCDSANQEKQVLLLWYLDDWLPEVVGHDFWDQTNRTTRRVTDKIHLPGDKSGNKKVLVPITGEAFGLLMFANCRERWIESFACQAKNNGKKPPQYRKNNPETHKYKNKWSSSRGGRQIGGGWDEEAFKYYNSMIAHLKSIRDEEKATGEKRFEKGLEIVRNHHKKRDSNSNHSNNDAPAKRRKKKTPVVLETTSKQTVIEILDE